METSRNRPSNTGHSFEIRTANLDYFVGEGEGGEQGESLASWEAAIRQALGVAGPSAVQPLSLPPSGDQVPDGAAAAPAGDAGAGSLDTQVGRGWIVIVLVVMAEVQVDISQSYQIFPDEVLGSGQFGIVYGGVHR